MSIEQQLKAGIAALGLALPEGAEAKLLAYLALLDKWNRVYNLTAVRDAAGMVSHHLLDSVWRCCPIFRASGCSTSAAAAVCRAVRWRWRGRTGG